MNHNTAQEVIRIGRELYNQRILDSHSGNISYRQGANIFITKSGAEKGNLKFEDIVRVNLENNLRDKEAGASVEVGVHRAIYKRHPQIQAIVHAHPPHAVVLSMDMQAIVPIDQEGPYYFKDVPVLTKCDWTNASDPCVVENLPDMFQNRRMVIMRGHGSVAACENLEEAYKITSVLESVCRIIWLKRVWDRSK